MYLFLFIITRVIASSSLVFSFLALFIKKKNISDILTIIVTTVFGIFFWMLSTYIVEVFNPFLPIGTKVLSFILGIVWMNVIIINNFAYFVNKFFNFIFYRNKENNV